MALYSTSTFGKDCSVACGSGFDSCSLIGVIEVERKVEELNQAYLAKIISTKHYPQSYTLNYDGITEEGTFINQELIKNEMPERIILVEHGIRPTGENNESMEIIVQSHGSAMHYEVGQKYYFFGRKIKDNIYETSKASCTVKLQ